MRQVLKVVFILIFGVSICNKLKAEHLIGSDISYQCVGQNANLKTTTIRVTMILYRDKTKTDFNKIIDVGVFRKVSNKNYLHYRTTQELLRENLNDPIQSASPCVEAPKSFEAERGFYIFDVSLPWGEDYYIVYQRCCRNGSISNIATPGEIGAAVSLTVSKESLAVCNSSPKFNYSPRLFVCIDDNLKIDNSAFDSDGDSLVYEFCAPFIAGGQQGTVVGEDPLGCDGVTPKPINCPPPYKTVQFVGNFTPNNPLPGSPGLSIDRKTGVVRGRPNAAGLYLIGICVKEYKKGVLIGEVLRDFQVFVAGPEQCNRAYLPFTVGSDNSSAKEIVLNSFRKDTIFLKGCGVTDVLYKNASIVRSTTPVTYEWIYDIGAGPVISTNDNLNVKYPSDGTYKSKLVIKPQFAECIDTINIVTDIRPKVDASFDVSIDSCKLEPAVFTNKTTTKVPLDTIVWDFNGEGTSNKDSPIFTFLGTGKKRVTLFVRNEDGCVDSAFYNTEYYPVPAVLDVKPDVFLACAPATITFLNGSSYITDKYEVKWDFGDGNTSTAFEGVNLYTKTGSYDIKLYVKSPSNCSNERIFKSLIDVKEKPLAKFDYEITTEENGSYSVNFKDLSEGADFIKWQFGELATSIEMDPSFTFQDTGTYVIEQKVFTSEGCIDTITATLTFKAQNFLFMPDAFTPNNDQLNDDFKPKGFFRGIRSFAMQIYNRYGEMIFETSDPLYGWNGLKFNSGTPAPADVYVYLVEYEDINGEKQLKKGNLSLLR